MSTHTPTPWITIHNGWQPWEGAVEIHARGETIAWTTWGGPETANAAFIVRAVNSHEALVKAGNAVIAALSGRVHSRPALSALGELEDALKSAES